MDVFARGTDGRLWHLWFTDGAWSTWESFDAGLTSAPSVASWGPGRLDVFVRGGGNNLFHLFFDGGWSRWGNLGGGLTSAPTVAAWGPGRLDVFLRGGSNQLFQIFGDGRGTWSGWVNFGGNLESAPAVTSWGPERLDIVARGMHNTLLHQWFDRGWSESTPREGPLTSAPAVASGDIGGFDVFGLDGDGNVRQRTGPQPWGPWHALVDAPVTPSRDPGSFDRSRALRVREDFCRLGHTLQVGYPAVKASSQAGLVGSDDELHRAATAASLEAAAVRDDAATAVRKQDKELRLRAWEAGIPGDLALPTESYVLFHVAPTRFSTSPYYPGFREHHDARYLFSKDLAPRASRESERAATSVAQEIGRLDTREARTAWQAWNSWPMRAERADDFRMFLQYGGFPTVAPERGSVEFRIDVEALKMRFASCDSTEPVDPFQVLGEEVTAAGVEWQAELDAHAGLRADIVAASLQADADLTVAADAMSEALGQSWVAGQLVKWQAYWLSHPTDWDRKYSYPLPRDFAWAKTEIVNAQNRARAQVPIAARAAASAAARAAKVEGAQEEAGRVAAANGSPNGRGLAYAQQSAQVTKASAAAAQAAAKATETALNATLATGSTSAALVASAQAQANATQAAFQRAAAKEAAEQARRAAVAADWQATRAAQAAARAKADRIKAEEAEAAARVSAAKADQQRQIAEKEQRVAAAERARADAERAKASVAEARAQLDRMTAAARRTDADTAAATAAQKRTEAEQAEKGARTARNAAVAAAERKDAAVARAEAAEARADALEGEQDAGAARAAAVQARTAANAATTAATSARSAADEATTAAVNARAAATRATAAAQRSRAAADKAKAAAAQTHAHAQIAHAAAADAIAAAQQAAGNVRAAQQLADRAKAEAAAAKADAIAARQHAEQAKLDSATSAGHAYAAGQYAAAASDSAAEVIKPANEAIALGSPYQQTDSSAALAVLVGQNAKTIAQQQEAVANARAAQAAQAARDAQAAAVRADVDAKAAAESAALAAAEAAKAAESVKRARVSAAAAWADAAAAVKADNNAAALDRQAQADATAADTAATTAEADASAARESATEAERDAASARTAATTAENDAAAARDSAGNAERDATAAETAAKNADADATAAEEAATRAEGEATGRANAVALSVEGAAGVDGVKAIAENMNNEVTFDGACITPWSDPFSRYCTQKLIHHITGQIRYERHTCPEPSVTHCPGRVVIDHLGVEPVDFWQHQTVQLDKFDLGIQILKGLGAALVEDLANCFTGKAGKWKTACAWVAAEFLAPAAIGAAARAIAAVRTSIRTGVGIDAALATARTAKVEAATLAALERDAARAIAGKCWTRQSIGGRSVVANANQSRMTVRNNNCIEYANFYGGRNGGVLAKLDENGVASFAISKGDSTPSGGQMFDDAMNHFGVDKVFAIEGKWVPAMPSNLITFNRLTAEGATAEMAAAQTFTGKMAAKYGFTRVRMGPLQGSPGKYTNVEVTFTK